LDAVTGSLGPVTADGRYHQYKRIDIIKTIKPSSKPIKRVSDKRLFQMEAYDQIKIKMNFDRDKGYLDCFFCNGKIESYYDRHHLKGRKGNLFTDKEWIVPAHNDCHVFKYHALDIARLMELKWYKSFLLRLRLKSEKLWCKELFKQVKAGLITGKEYNKLIEI